MTERSLVFKTEEDAFNVAEQLHNCTLKHNEVIFHQYDDRAVMTAVNLANASISLIPGSRCRLPFPKHERECTDVGVPQIYVRCLSAYNAGCLHGMSIDATQDAEEIKDDIKWMLSYSPVADTEPCEEWAIHSYDFFEGIALSECESIKNVAALGQAILDHGKSFAEFQGYFNYDDVAQAVEEFTDRFMGVYKSEEDFAYEQLEQDGTLDRLEKIGFSENYINWDAIVNDMECGGGYLFIRTGFEEVHVFGND